MGYNEYSEFNVTVKNLSIEEMSWFDHILSSCSAQLPLDEDDDPDVVDVVSAFIKDENLSEEYEFPQFDYIFARGKKENGKNYFDLDIFPKEQGYSEATQVAKLLHDFINRFKPEEKFVFRWIRWDNRRRNSYNGGAFKIDKNGIESIDLKEWCRWAKR